MITHIENDYLEFNLSAGVSPAETVAIVSWSVRHRPLVQRGIGKSIFTTVRFIKPIVVQLS